MGNISRIQEEIIKTLGQRFLFQQEQNFKKTEEILGKAKSLDDLSEEELEIILKNNLDQRTIFDAFNL